MWIDLTLSWSEIQELHRDGFTVVVVERAPTIDELYYVEVRL